MAKDKTFEWRMEGMIYAYNIAKKEGIEALASDIKKRGILKAPMKFTQKQMDEFWKELSLNVYNNMLANMAYALHEGFGFGKIRLHRVKDLFNRQALNALDLDWMGEHYVKLEDYAIEMNEKYNLGLDINRIAACQDTQDEEKEYTGRCKVDTVLELLKSNGYADAAAFLEKKMGRVA